MLGKEHAADVMRFGSSGSRSVIAVRRRGHVIVVWNGGWQTTLSGAEVLGFLIMVTKSSGNTGREMFGDKVDCQSRKSGKMTTSDGAEKGGCDGAAKGGMMIES